jgi:biotin synthase
VNKAPKRPIFLCTISNITSGTCKEDCKFCTQSVRYHADIERYSTKPIEAIVDEAKRANELGALGFCLVTAGKGLDDKRLRYVSEAATAIKKVVPDLNLIACNGTANVDQLRILKNSGINSYNHNLETAQSYYGDICTTHDWQERLETCENVKKADLKLCTGGIFGMGESEEQQYDLIQTIANLDPVSVPMNFYHHNEALPLQPNSLSVDHALHLIQTMRQSIGSQKRLMIAGGREVMFGQRQHEIFEAGANAIVIGNYLTTEGQAPHHDLQMLRDHDLKIASSCND